MKMRIGSIAGEIWNTLHNNGETTITELSKTLKMKSSDIYQAIGWLAREDKIEYRTQGRKVYVSLVDTERVFT